MIPTGLRAGVTARTAAVAAADAALLCGDRPQLGTLRRLVAAPGGTLAELGADRTIAVCTGAGLWLVAAWVGIGLVAVAGSGLPGTLGRGCAALGRLVPRTLQHAVGLALGIGLVAGPAAATAATPAPHQSVPAQSVVSRSGVAQSVLDGVHGDAPGPSWPVTPGTGPHPPPARHRPARAPMPPLTPTTPPTRTPTGTGVERVRVRAGDSLWLIAARRVPHPSAESVAAYWPRVYAANRTVVGADPDHIVPGQLLRLPAPPDVR